MGTFLRMRRGVLHTAVCRFRHPDTGRRVTVVGMSHIGQPDYYQRVRHLVDELHTAGATVLCEGSTARIGDQIDQASPDRAALLALAQGSHLFARRVPGIGWAAQAEALGWPEHWTIVDLDAADIIRRKAPQRSCVTPNGCVASLPGTTATPRDRPDSAPC